MAHKAANKKPRFLILYKLTFVKSHYEASRYRCRMAGSKVNHSEEEPWRVTGQRPGVRPGQRGDAGLQVAPPDDPSAPHLPGQRWTQRPGHTALVSGTGWRFLPAPPPRAVLQSEPQSAPQATRVPGAGPGRVRSSTRIWSVQAAGR